MNFLAGDGMSAVLQATLTKIIGFGITANMHITGITPTLGHNKKNRSFYTGTLNHSSCLYQQVTLMDLRIWLSEWILMLISLMLINPLKMNKSNFQNLQGSVCSYLISWLSVPFIN